MEVRGSVTDRPWGLTLGAIALRRHTGQLTVDSDGKRYAIAFQDGAIVAASSPPAADGIARGARTNLAEQRLIDDLRQLGSYFVLKPESLDELPRYGFETTAQPVLDALRFGTSLPELEASNRDVDPRFAQAIIYALVSCTACVIPQRTATQTARTVTPPTGARALTPRNVTPRASSRELRAATADQDTRPAGGRAPTPPSSPAAPFGSRTSTLSSSYSGSGSQDSGTNTPAATRTRNAPDTRPDPLPS